jgi:PAS domain S-box-containing protein
MSEQAWVAGASAEEAGSARLATELARLIAQTELADMDGLLDVVATSVGTAFNGGCGVLLADPAASVLRAAALHHPDAALLDSGRQVFEQHPWPAEVGPGARAMATGVPAVAAGAEVARLAGALPPAYGPVLAAAAVSAVVCVPLIVRGRTLGVLFLFRSETADFREAELQLLQDVAVQAASAIDNSRTYGELHRVKETVQRQESFLQEVLDSLPAAAAVLDDTGRIAYVNEPWTRFCGDNDGDMASCGVGADYLAVCDGATGDSAEEGPAVAAGLREVLTGATTRFTVDYPCPAADGTARWFALVAVPAAGGAGGVLVLHEDITARKLAEQRLSDSEARFRLMFDDAPIGMALVDTAGAFLRVNDALAAITGYDRDALVGMSFQQITHPDDVDADVALAHELLDGRRHSYIIEKRYRRADGAVVWVRMHGSLMRDAHGTPQYFLAQVEDVTTRRMADARAVRETERLQTAITVQREITAAAQDRDATLRLVAQRAVETFPAADGSVVELIDGDTLVYTAAAGTLAGALGMRIERHGSLSGLAIAENTTMRCDDSQSDPRVDRQACRRVGVASMLIAPLHADDEVIGVLKVASRAAAAFDGTDVHQLELLASSLTSALRHAEDFTRNARLLAERTDALAALADTERRFRLAFDNSPLGMALTSLAPDRLGHFLQVNPAMAAITGYDAETLVRMRFDELDHPEDVTDGAMLVQRLRDGEIDTATVEQRYRRADAETVWVRVRTAVVRDDTGAGLYLVSQVEDITAARHAQAQLEQQASLLALTPAAVIVRDLDGTIRWWNTGAEATYGWPAAAAVGRRTHRLLATRFGDSNETVQAEQLLTEGAWTGELSHLRADGQVLTVLSRQGVQRDRDGHPIAVLEINTDITQRRAAELALAESEQRFRAQFAHSAIGQFIRGLDGRLQDVNPAMATLLHADVASLVGTDLHGRLDAADRSDLMLQMATVFAGDADAFHVETRLRRTDDSWVDVHLTQSVVREQDGTPKHVVGVVHDISDRQHAERARDAAAAELAAHNEVLERVNAELGHANQVKTDVMGMLSHEIGTPLTSILGHAEVLQELVEPATAISRSVGVVMRNARNLVDLRDEILTMVAGDTGRLRADREPVAVAAAIKHAQKTVDQEVPVSGADDPAVFASGKHVQQILVNLLSNATKYAGGATGIDVSVTDTDVTIAVRDHGPGIPAELATRLFQRFSRGSDTTSRQRGTGLGLFIVKTLAEANRGTVWHEPNTPAGSVFALRLPRYRPSAPAG